MNWKRRIVETRCAGCLGGVLAALLGLLLWATPLGQWLVCLSYDLPFLFGPEMTATNLVLVCRDEACRAELKQSYEDWDRTWHAHLLNRLTEDRARLVVLDIYLTEPGRTAANTALSNAIAAHGNVVLAADLKIETKDGLGDLLMLVPPREEFMAAAKSWGIARQPYSAGSVVRQFFPSTELHPTLSWAAAAAAGARATQSTPDPNAERWINYYTRFPHLAQLSYCEVTNRPPGYFRDKWVFIGSRPEPGFQGELTDQFRTPRRLWGEKKSPGMEIHATAFLNLLRMDWLNRTSHVTEFWVLLASGLLLGFGLSLVRPLPAAGLAGLALVATATLAILVFWHKLVWFPWSVIVAVQIPTALAWSVLLWTRRLQKSLTQVEAASRRAPPPAAVPRPPHPLAPTTEITESPRIPDYVLKRLMGEGSYGQVWLAQDIIGTYHAVKIIKRSRFDDDRPYEREFMGMKHFTPISRDHPGLVQVLHVGRNDDERYFYYVMEAADDAETGRAIDPDRYTPKNLDRLLQRRGCLPIRECLQLCLPLASALAYLHERQLIHRDIKPSNIIFVNHAPKIADIGLVTNVKPIPSQSSFVGTEDFLPRHGYGLPSADVYALGKVLYLMSLGSLHQFPALPTDLGRRPDRAALLAINDIVLQACDDEPAARYPSAREFLAALRDAQSQLEAGNAT